MIILIYQEVYEKALHFQLYLQASEEEKDSNDFQDQSTSPKMTGSQTEQQPVAREPLPSDEDIVHVLGPADPVPISPLPGTPQKAVQTSAKAVAVSRLKASMERCKQLQALADKDTEVTAESVAKQSSKKEVLLKLLPALLPFRYEITCEGK